MKRIGVWNTAFLGDAVLTLPLIQSLRLRFPQAEIDFYVRGGLTPLFSAHPAITNVYGYDKRGKEKGISSLLRFGQTIARRDYSIWVCAHESSRSAMIARLSGAPMRIGYNSSFFQRFVHTHTVSRRFDELDEIERLLQLLRPLGDGPVEDWPLLVLPQSERDAADDFFSGLGQGPFLGVHPGSVWGTKRWPADYFAFVGAKAIESGAQVIIFAGPGEEATAQQVEEGIRAQVSDMNTPLLHNLSGALSLPRLAAYIARLDCYVTNDSGPMHIAWAQHTPVAAIFGPTVRALGFFPRGSSSYVHEIPLSCRPCGLHGPQVCPLGHHRCMKDVTPESVWQGVQATLQARRD